MLKVSVNKFQQVSEFLDTKRKTTLGQEELTPVVSVRIGELNKMCKQKGIESMEQAKVRKAVAQFGIGRWQDGTFNFLCSVKL